MNLNKVQLIGRLTADPELRTTASGQPVANFGLATNRYWTKDGQRQEETEFHTVVVWGRQAEVASQFLKKGALAYIEGRLQTRTWQDKEGGNRKTTEIVAERVQFGPRAGGAPSPTGAPGGTDELSSSSESSSTGSSKQDEKKPFDDTSAGGGQVGKEESLQNDPSVPDITLDEDEVKAEDVPF